MTEAARTLASKEGLARFLAILNAQEAWSSLTRVQKGAIFGRLHGDVHPRTLAALERRGLAKNGLMTEWGDFVRVVNTESTERES